MPLIFLSAGEKILKIRVVCFQKIHRLEKVQTYSENSSNIQKKLQVFYRNIAIKMTLRLS